MTDSWAGDAVCDISAGAVDSSTCRVRKCHFLIKETSVFSAVALADLMYVAKDLIGLYYKTDEALLMLVVSYLILLLPVSLFAAWLEGRLRYAGFGN